MRKEEKTKEELILAEIRKVIEQQKQDEVEAAKSNDTVEYWRMFYHCHRRLEKLLFDISQLVNL